MQQFHRKLDLISLALLFNFRSKVMICLPSSIFVIFVTKVLRTSKPEIDMSEAFTYKSEDGIVNFAVLNSNKEVL